MPERGTGGGWLSTATRTGLVLALEARRESVDEDAESSLDGVFARLGAEARAASQPPEAVLAVFRDAWDRSAARHSVRDTRDLAYYGLLSQCLDRCFSAPPTGSCRRSPR